MDCNDLGQRKTDIFILSSGLGYPLSQLILPWRRMQLLVKGVSSQKDKPVSFTLLESLFGTPHDDFFNTMDRLNILNGNMLVKDSELIKNLSNKLYALIIKS